MNASAANASARRDIAAEITNKILAELERGVLPWRKPWDSARSGGVVLPRRSNGEPYRGVNIITLWSASIANGFASPFWLTFKQAGQLGASIRKGERGVIVVYYGQAAKKTAEANEGDKSEPGAFRFLKYFIAFNADQIAGLPDQFYPERHEPAPMPLPTHEAWFSRLGITRIQTRDRAFYSPSRDVIGMPPLSAFQSAELYAATLNHEACHATGASHRLDRDFSKRFGESAYAAEELVAEIGSAILGAHLDMPPSHIEDHASYIGHWMKFLSEDKRAFLTAAGKAQAAVDWLLDKSKVPGAPLEQAFDVAA